MTRHMNGYRTVALLLTAATLAGCDKNRVQQLPVEPLLDARIKFFNYGVSAPGVNFYADETKMTAIQSGTGSEANTGVAYGAVGNGGAYAQIASGPHTLTGRIAAAIDKNLPIATLNTAIDAGKFYSFYMSGFYNTAAKTSDSFLLEDLLPADIDWTAAVARFVHAIPNANPLTLYATNQVTNDTIAVGGAVAYKSGGSFAALPAGVYNLFARYTGETTNRVVRIDVSLVAGRVYTVGARGDITITSATATNRPFLDNTANR
jgi:hypothetical protein